MLPMLVDKGDRERGRAITNVGEMTHNNLV